MKFRALIGLFVLLTLAAGTASAQNPITASIKGGVNFATFSGEVGEGASKSMRTAGVFGGGISTMINDRLTFDIDVLYSMEGTKYKDPLSLDSNSNVTAKMEYVRVPLLLRIAAGAGPRHAYLLVGPSIGILTSAKADFEGQRFDFKDEFKSTDFALVLGAGIAVDKLFVESRYTMGLININKDSDTETNRNQVVSLLIGGRF